MMEASTRDERSADDDIEETENVLTTAPVDAHFSAADSLPPENDDQGNTEYKWLLPSAPSEAQLERLQSQLTWRLDEGYGEAVYLLGVRDDGEMLGTDDATLEASIVTLRSMAERAGADICVVARRVLDDACCAQVLVRRRAAAPHSQIDVRFGISGNVDVGKSTLIGCLTRSMLDDARGSARSAVFNHPHELSSGRTSSIAHHLLGFDSAGQCANRADVDQSWGELIQRSAKLVTLYDLAGHERYLKTTVRGLSGQMPDYALLLVAANKGVTQMTQEHLALCLALGVPPLLVITKIDMAPPDKLKQTLQEVRDLFSKRGIKRMVLRMRDANDLAKVADLIAQRKSRIVPLFVISCVSGAGLDLLRQFLNLSKPRIDWSERADEPAEVQIDSIYYVQGAGTVVGGMVVAGRMREAHEHLLLGPDSSGRFEPVHLRSIHAKRVLVRAVDAGHSAGFALRKVRRDSVRTGMVLIDARANPTAHLEFEVDMYVLYHSTTIMRGYAPVIQCLNVRQCARLIDMHTVADDAAITPLPQSNVPQQSAVSGAAVSDAASTRLDAIRTGSHALCRFRFLYRPERLRVGTRVLINEGKTKAFGVISRVFAKEEELGRHALGGRRSRRRHRDGGRRRRRASNKKSN